MFSVLFRTCTMLHVRKRYFPVFLTDCGRLKKVEIFAIYRRLWYTYTISNVLGNV